jgi:signal transduction histidine kinase
MARLVRPLPVLASCLLLAVAASVFAQPGVTAAVERTAQVLVITGSDPYLPGFALIDRGMRTSVAGSTRRHVHWLYESVDTARFGGTPGPEVAELYARKYRDTRIDVVVLVTEPAAEFYLRYRDRLWPHAPVVVHTVSPAFAEQLPPAPWLTGLTTREDAAGTLRIAQALQPDARRVLVVGGVAPFDMQQFDRVREAAPQFDRLDFEYVAGPSLATIAERLATETRDTIVYYTALFRDASGDMYVPRDALEVMVRSSAAPIYGTFDSQMGYGIAAGSMEPFGDRGERVGALVVRALQGEALPPIATVAASRCIVDARQLKRYGIPSRRVPEDCEVRFVEASPLRQYWWQALLVAGVIAAQAVLIAQLMLQRRQRRLAELRLQENRSQLLHASRLAVAGELTASIAHEINQPLGAILSNAQAAEMLLDSGRGAPAELLQILRDIRNDDLRASQVIKRLRALLARHEVELAPCDLNQIAGDAVAILRGEARRRGVTLEFAPDARAPDVRGDPVQLQQVIIALALNAFDASADLPEGERRVRIGTGDAGDDVALAVRDFGAGIAESDLPRVFDSFFTTKDQGMGLGLSIARTIVDSHGGSISVANAEPGAEFRVALPRVAQASALHDPKAT